jgi:L-ascorbate metabolism protein UlaG (beta-lactamase superfamily)
MSARTGLRLFMVATSVLALAIALAGASPVLPAQAQPAPGQVKIEWLGSSAYRLTSPLGKIVLTNPDTTNPDSPVKATDIQQADVILVTDGTSSAVGSTVALAQATGATVLAPGGVNSWLIERGVPREQVPRPSFQPGQRYLDLPGITVRSVESVHGSEVSPPTPSVAYGGVAAGYFITFENGWTVYFAASSAAMAEQGLWAQMYTPDLAILDMAADHDPIDFAEQVKLLQTQNPKLKTILPQQNRVSPPAGQTTIADVQAAMDRMGLGLPETQQPLAQAVLYP